MAADLRLKLVIIGDGGCGKTVLLYSFMHQTFREEYIPNVLDTYMVQIPVGKEKLALEVYDTAGQEEFVEIRKLVYPGTSVFLICYNCVHLPSLKNIMTLWYPEISKVVPNVPFLLVGCKLDLVAKQRADFITPDLAEKMRRQLGGYAAMQCSAWLEVKAKAGNVPQVFKTAIACGLEHLPLLKPAVCKCTLL